MRTDRLVPILARSVGFLPVFFPPEGSLGHAPVDTLPFPVDPDQVVVLVEGSLPQLAEHAPPLPPLEVPVETTAGPELGRDGLPVTTRPQDVEDAIEDVTIGQAGAATPGGPPNLREERFHPIPQGIRHTKRLDNGVTCGGHDDSPQWANPWALTLYSLGSGIGS